MMKNLSKKRAVGGSEAFSYSHVGSQPLDVPTIFMACYGRRIPLQEGFFWGSPKFISSAGLTFSRVRHTIHG